MTLINTVLIRYTVPGPARPAGKRGTASGPPEILLLLLNFQFDYLRLEKKENQIKLSKTQC